MKKIIILIILVTTMMSCSYMEAADREIKERGLKCFYNHKREFLGCRFADE